MTKTDIRASNGVIHGIDSVILPKGPLRSPGQIERIMKRVMSVSLPVAALVVALDRLAGTGLESINDESRRWSMPITGGITARF